MDKENLNKIYSGKNTFILVSMPLIVIGVLNAYCWANILFTDISAAWRHYIGFILFICLILTHLKSTLYSVVGICIYLLLATFNFLAFTPKITTSWIRIGPFSTPQIQLLALGMIVFYSIVNLDRIIDIYLDFKENIKRNHKK